jgi:hypothetical protein
MSKTLSLHFVFAVAAFAAAFTVKAAWSPLGIGIGVLEDKTLAEIPSKHRSIYGLRLGFHTAANSEMYGLAFSIVGNGGTPDSQDWARDGDVAGLQLALLYNYASTSSFGVWQVSSFLNDMGGDAFAVQLSGLRNFASGEFTGVQIAGIANIAYNGMKGVQIAGIYNEAFDMSGLQIVGIYNCVNGTLRGVQIGAFNFAENAYGVQVGVVNYAERAYGVQVGVVNYAERANGVQIGAVNMLGQEFAGAQIGAINTWDSASALFIPALRVYF